MKRKDNTLLYLGLGALAFFALRGGSSDKTKGEEVKTEKPSGAVAPSEKEVVAKKTGAFVTGKTPKFLRGESLRQFKAAKEEIDKTGFSPTIGQRVTALEAALIPVEFAEVLQALGISPLQWQQYKFVQGLL